MVFSLFCFVFLISIYLCSWFLYAPCMGFSVQDVWHFLKCICHMLLFLVWDFCMFFGVDFGSYNVVPVCLALLQWYFRCPVCLASFGMNFQCALFFAKFWICFGGFLNIQHTSAWIYLFFFFCVLLPHLFFPPPIFLAFLVLSLFGIFYHTSRACFMCICSFHVLCLVFVFIAIHVFCMVWVYCARFSTQTVFGGFFVHI